MRKWLCKREKIKGKEVFLFYFSGVWIDREVSNYTSLFPYFRPLPCNQTTPRGHCTCLRSSLLRISNLTWYFSFVIIEDSKLSASVCGVLPPRFHGARLVQIRAAIESDTTLFESGPDTYFWAHEMMSCDGDVMAMPSSFFSFARDLQFYGEKKVRNFEGENNTKFSKLSIFTLKLFTFMISIPNWLIFIVVIVKNWQVQVREVQNCSRSWV